MRLDIGHDYPLGAHWDGSGINFALFSANATRVELCLFDSNGENEIARLELPGRTNDSWHGYLRDSGPGTLYGYRVYGPYEPVNGHRFNPNKLLIDPYARAFYGQLVESTENYGYVVDSPELDLSFDKRDNAKNIPKCVVIDSRVRRENYPHIRHELMDSIIYEAHVKGATKQLQGISLKKRGTYGALASQPFTHHLKDLGITALELLPVHAFCDDERLVKAGMTNYWGYNTLSFFVPESRYAEKDPVGEFRKMVRTLHQQGIEVILDVVYNHTAEGNELGPTLCYRGIDNASYYRLLDNRRYYVNDSGCGNTLDAAHPRVLQMIMDSLRYWAVDMHVDGFRFDLASILGRESYGFDRGAGFFDAIRQEPSLAAVKLIAEPWDLGPGGYQLGHFPIGWSEWNDRSRDLMRQFWNGDPDMLQSLSKVMHGSSELFEWQQRGPDASINFITSHDGFTLQDLVSYNTKHNEVNGEKNRDGHSHNLSYNHGVEGQTEDPVIIGKRDRHRRNLMTTLLLAQGVPMIVAGDEFGRTQSGNNNAYCQDNESTWLDWKLLARDKSFYEFVKKLIKLRSDYAVWRRRYFLHGTELSPAWGVPDIQWLNQLGLPMSEQDWHATSAYFLGLLLPGDAPEQKGAAHHAGRSGQDNTGVLILMNNSDVNIDFPLPSLSDTWWSRLDTANPSQPDHAVHKQVRCSANSIQVCTSVLSIDE